MDTLRTHNEFKELLNKCNPYVDIREPYKGFGKDTLFYCCRCNKEFIALPEVVLRANNGCPYCKKRRTAASNDNFLEKMKTHPTILPLEPYIHSEISIYFQCQKCGYIWKTTPTSILGGSGCMMCHRQSQKYTQEQFEEKVYALNPNIKILGKYQRSDRPVEVQCLICGNIWSPTARSLMEGHGCLQCVNQNKKYSLAEVMKFIQEKGADITFTGTYVNLNTPVEAVCNRCGYIWKPYPANILKNGKCPNCVNIQQTRTNQQYLELLKDKNDSIIPLEEYKNARTPIMHRCLVCGNEWKAYPDNILKGHGCPRCGHEITVSYTRISPEEYVQKLLEVHGDTITPLESYQGCFIPMLFLCNKCGHQWKAEPHSVLSGRGCPNCASSRGEKAISLYLQRHQIPYEPQKKFPDLKGIGGRALRYDFYLPTYNTIIEFNGKQHYQNVEYFGGEEGWIQRQEHDRRKVQYARDHDITFIAIRYDENICEVLDQYFNVTNNNLKLESRETVMAM